MPAAGMKLPILYSEIPDLFIYLIDDASKIKMAFVRINGSKMVDDKIKH